MTTEADLALPGGRTLHWYDTGGGPLTVLWQHGTPNLGAPPEPLFPAGARLGIRWLSYDRPGYGGSTREPDRDLAAAARYASAVADAAGVERFAVMGYSGGGSHAIACAALLPDRVLGVVTAGALAPRSAEDLDWYAGMADPSALRAAARGRAARERHVPGSGPDFTPADLAALDGDWSWLGKVAGAASRDAPDGAVDDDVAYAGPWRFDPTRVGAPVLLLHGGQDRVVPATHGQWLARHLPDADLRLRPGDGHVSILTSGVDGLVWLVSRVSYRA
jgi:pimeloyl-ACP methyl ester carboxylesterase